MRLVTGHEEVIWSTLQPMHGFTACAKLTPDWSPKIFQPGRQCELFIWRGRIRGQAKYYYMGTYMLIPLQDLTPTEYGLLTKRVSETIRARSLIIVLTKTLIKQKEALAHQTSRSRPDLAGQDLDAAYLKGQLTAQCIGLRCLGFNKVFYEALIQPPEPTSDVPISSSSKAKPEETEFFVPVKGSKRKVGDVKSEEDDMDIDVVDNPPQKKRKAAVPITIPNNRNLLIQP